MTAFELERLTAGQAAEVGSLPAVVGMLPLGSIEQHGPHLPLATDLWLAQHLARRVAEASGFPVLIAPPIPGGRSDHHLHFPATLSISEALYADLIRLQIGVLARLGVGRVALISAHGGNFQLAGEIATSMTAAHAEPRLVVKAYSDFARFNDVMHEAARSAGLAPTETDVHAGVIETSMALHLFGELVQPFEHLEGYVHPEPGWLERMNRDGLHALSANGILGRPQGSRADAGARVLSALEHELARWLTEAFVEVPVGD